MANEARVNEPRISARELDYRYGGGPPVLRGVTLDVADGVTAIVGPSGSGKSTLLYALAGVVRATAGEILYRGNDLVRSTDEQIDHLRRTAFGFVFQFGELVPELTLLENIALPLDLAGAGRRERRRRVTELASELGIDQVLGRRPSEVSGGQAQRAAVARALVHEPDVVFADEPTGSLDQTNGAAVLSEMLRLTAEKGSAVLLVTHDEQVASRADRVVEMVDGTATAPRDASSCV